MAARGLVAKLCPVVYSPPGSSVHGNSQAKYWSGLPFPSPEDIPDPGIELASPALAGRFFFFFLPLNHHSSYEIAGVNSR